MNVLTTVHTTVDVPLNCENNGTNIGLHFCACVPGWTGLICEQCKLAQKEQTCFVSCGFHEDEVCMKIDVHITCGVFSVYAN